MRWKVSGHVEAHRRTSLLSLSLLLQQCPKCLVYLIWMVWEIGGKWLYICCYVNYCFQDLFSITCSILVQSPFSFFSICFISIHRVHLYSSIDTTAAYGWNRLPYDWYIFARCILTSLSVDEMLLLRYINLSTNFREPPFRVEISPWLKHMYSILSTFTLRLMPPAACSSLCSRDSAWVGVFARSALSSVESASVIVSVGYHLFLAFFLV